MSYFATPYTIHFDDTMAYGSHHFLTGFKFQCAARETLLYGDLIYDRAGVREALDTVHLLTAEAYSRNLGPAFLGDRVAILITLEEWGRVSARFCYRVLGQDGRPICAGFQTMICTAAKDNAPIPLPEPLRLAFDAIREITEVPAEMAFRDRVLSGAEATLGLFTTEVRGVAMRYLMERYPAPQVIRPLPPTDLAVHDSSPTGNASASINNAIAPADATLRAVQPPTPHTPPQEVWLFPGQGAFDARLLSERVGAVSRQMPHLRAELDYCAEIAAALIGGDASGLVSGTWERCAQAVRDLPGLLQVGIHLQGVLGARLRGRRRQPAVLVGHSFGELAALNVAGCFDLPTGVRIVCERVRATDTQAPPDGGLCVAGTNRRTVMEEIAVGGWTDLVVAGRNHEQQTVVSGPREQLYAFQDHLRKVGIQTVDVPSPTCFHHPLLRKAAQAWLRQLQEIDMRPPSLTVYSPIGRRIISASDDLPSVMVSQFLRPFDLQGAIEDLVAAGYSMFVDCGSRGSLARLVRAAGPSEITVESSDAGLSVVPKPVSLNVSQTEGLPDAHDGTLADTAHDRSPVQPENCTEEGTVERRAARPPIAIVGLGCLLPGRATSPAELHRALLDGRLGIFDLRDVDPDWERDFYSAKLAPDRSTSALAGLVDDRDLCCPPGVDPDIFAGFSRAQKLLCVALAPCVEQLRSAKRVLCLMGTTADGFQDQDQFSALRFAGVDGTDERIAQRLQSPRSTALQDPYTAVQEVFDRVVGPGPRLILVDAACASSLYTVALGMTALENGEADLVLAGGLFCPGPGNNCLFSQFGGLTATGCRPFDAQADGVIFSEGAALVVLQRLADAERAGASIVAVLRGAGLSSDGRSPSANVPQSAGQLLALQRCYTNYAISPASIAAIEGHGTSTPVGDSVELKTLSQFFGAQAQSPIPLHSLKGLLGHTGWAAGTASILAACEILRTRVFPAQAFHRHPSSTLTEASRVLHIPTEPLRLPPQACRIAIDGFGFGGANAHVVIQSYPCSKVDTDPPAAVAEMAHTTPEDDDDLVIVAWHHLPPEAGPPADGEDSGTRFAREHISLPEGMLILPDLADDMDISQKLALSAIASLVSKIGGLDEQFRRETSIVLALAGKTERAVIATARVLAPRLIRALGDLPAASALQRAMDHARPSGPYTLQCMMPNVSAGRAALQFNLNGPNFVVDAGANSLDAALITSRLLLRSGEQSGTKLVVLAAIHANRWPVPCTDAARSEKEYALALALTTARYARQFGLPIIDRLDSLLGDGVCGQDFPLLSPYTTTQQKVDALVEALKRSRQETAAEAARQSVEVDEFPIHVPVWVETPHAPATRPDGHGQLRRDERWLVLTEDDPELLTELRTTLPDFCSQALLAVAGASRPADIIVSRDCTTLPVDLHEENSIRALQSQIEAFCPDIVVAVQRTSSWEPTAILRAVAANQLGELLFLAAKQIVPQLRAGTVEIWGVFPDGWRDCIHPITGPICGFIKSVRREFPRIRGALISQRDATLRDAFCNLQRERSRPCPTEPELVVDGERRWVRRLRPVAEGIVPTSRATTRVPLDRDSVVLASGGARGVTAVLVESLLQDVGCTVIALGRSPLERGPDVANPSDAEAEYFARYLAENPQASPREMKRSFEAAWARWEAQATIDRLAGAGGQLHYRVLDINCRSDVDRLVRQIVLEFGRVDWIVHGAGVQWSKKLENRTLSEFRQTYQVKLQGLQNLVECCQAHLHRVVPVHVLTSAYSIFGNDGQHDYGAANETLDRLCGLTAISGEPIWSSIAWSAWDGIGMTRGSEYRALAERRNLALLGPQTGQRIFQSVIQGKTASAINVPLSAAERTRYQIRTIPSIRRGSWRRTFEFPVDLRAVECLQFHKARDAATLPGAWILDLMVQSVLTLVGRAVRYFTIEDMQFHRFVRVMHDHDPQLRVVSDETADGYQAWLIGNVLNPAGMILSSDVIFATAKLSPAFLPELEKPRLNGIRRNHKDPVRLVQDPYCARNPHIHLSGPFQCLPEIEVGELGRRAIFQPDHSPGWQGVVPSLLVDASLRVAGMHVVPDALHVPTRIQRVVVPVGMTTDSRSAAGWRIRTSAPLATGDHIRCDRVEVTDPQGELQLLVEGAVVTRLQ